MSNYDSSTMKDTSVLRDLNIRSVMSALVKFGEDSSLMVARPGKPKLCCCLPMCWFTVPEGFYALVTRFGKEELYNDASIVWPAGLHVGPPWLRVSHLVTKQSMIFNSPVKGCKTSDNVTVEIDVSIVLRVMGEEDPENVRKFVHHLTAMGLTNQLADAQAEAVRTMARSVTHTEVFGLRSISAAEMEENISRIKANASFSSDDSEVGGQEKKDLEGDHDVLDDEEAVFAVEHGAMMVTKNLKNRLNSQFKPQGIEILEVIIENINLPSDIQNQMSQKTMVISQNAEQRMQHKFDMQVLEQTETIKMIKQQHSEEKTELRTDGEAKSLDEQLKLLYMKEKAKKDISKIKLQNSRDVRMIDAESSLQVNKVDQVCAKEVSRIELSAEAESAKAYSDTNFTINVIKAQADLDCAKLSAQADKTMFKAEGMSAPKIRSLNNHITSVKKLEVQGALARNEHVIITGKSGGTSANKILLTDACISNNTKYRRSTNDGIAELALASGKADVRLYMNQQ